MAKIREAYKAGLIAGLLSGIFTILMMQVPRGTATAVFQYAAIIVYVSGVYVGVKRTRDRENGGEIDFKGALKAGMQSGALGAALISIFQFFIWASTDVRENIAEMRAAGVGDQEIRNALASMTNSNFMGGAFMLWIINTIIAFFMSIMVAMLLRKRTA